MPISAPELTAALEAMLLRALAVEWRTLNHGRFGSRMQLPLIELSRTDGALGRWITSGRRMQFARNYVTTACWGAVREVIKHEMAHQFVAEVLGVHDETAHGATFQKLCADLGVDGRATGAPQVELGADDARVAARIAKLLALAESQNQHEAETAMLTAQRLMLTHNIAASALGGSVHFGFRHVGQPSGRIQEHERLLANVLQQHFFVDAIWVPVYRPLLGKDASALELSGTTSNLDIAEYAHGFLQQSADHLWRDHKRTNKLRGDRDRRMFLAGVIQGFAEKLRAAEVQHAEQGLVWVRSGDQAQYFKRRHPRVRQVAYGGQRRGESYDHGREAGQKLVLHRGVAGGPAERGRLLGT
jgi:Protein of unknown function (DUF2786)